MTRNIKIGALTIGGGNPVRVQSMTNTDTADVRSTVAQIRRLEEAGCEIIRVAVNDAAAARAVGRIKKQIRIPLVADVHFDYRLALAAIEQGADKIRINPGNIGSEEKVRAVINAAKNARIPVRIGINAGSLKKVIAVTDKKAVALGMANTALDYVRMFERWNFTDIVISVKAADVVTTIEVYRALAEKTDYPLHLGITESGPAGIGTVKSSIGIGLLLSEGIGDTIRVSLTGDPEREITTAYQILQALELRDQGIEIISCPTCGRCAVKLEKIVTDFERDLGLFFRRYSKKHGRQVSMMTFPRHLKVALMGCEVNGPGEAKSADIGIAGGRNTGLLFKKGKPVMKVSPGEWGKAIIQEIEKILEKK